MATPDHFPFPFEPYGIQEKFMHSLYSVLEEKKLGIFESPTGTVRAVTFLLLSCKFLSLSSAGKVNEFDMRCSQMAPRPPRKGTEKSRTAFDWRVS